ncbi:MAG: hypothetical protein JSV65_17305 [Armatimonadota bacterium]|nr:MAG: hypothetical protein JSV65_17305 [Armatimonadota bacterium]
MSDLRVAYVYDHALHAGLNASQANYWDIYLREICEQLGLRAETVSVADLESATSLSRLATLVIGWQSAAALTTAAKRNLDDWVRAGGTLIAFGLGDLDHVFGIEPAPAVAQAPGEYAISGYFDLLPHRLTEGIHSEIAPQQKLLILSDLRPVRPAGGVELARLYDAGKRPTVYAAVAWNEYGAGRAGYFAFDVAKTVWLLHQGRPVWDIPESRTAPKTTDMSLIGDNSPHVLYSYEILLLLQSMIAERPHPFIYAIPPQGNEIPDALFIWGGDEYAGPVERSLFASDWMRAHGLGYHINLEVENHPITAEQARHITEDNGHEISLYYRLRDEDGYRMTEEVFGEQASLFTERFGRPAVCSVNFVLRWQGWVEPAKYIAGAGGLGDNSFLRALYPATADILHNSPLFAFSFGTSLPYFFYDDHGGANKRINVIEEPIVCYEIGHRGSILDRTTQVLEEVRAPVDAAIRYHLLMNMFYHPVYIAEFPLAREAIEEILRCIGEKGALALHMGNDAACLWWHARSQCDISEVQIADDGQVTFEADCAYDLGMIVKLPADVGGVADVLCDAQPAPYEVRREFGGDWIHVVVPPGQHTVEVRSARSRRRSR